MAIEDLATRRLVAVYNATAIGLRLGGPSRGWHGSIEQLRAKRCAVRAQLARRGIVMEDDDLDIEDGPPAEPAQGGMEFCLAPSCPEFARSSGLCPAHYLKWRKGDGALAQLMSGFPNLTGQPQPTPPPSPWNRPNRRQPAAHGPRPDASPANPPGGDPPATPDPPAPPPAMHEEKTMPRQPTCAVPGCTRPAKLRGICPTHYQQQARGVHADNIRRYMSPSKTAPKGDKLACEHPSGEQPEPSSAEATLAGGHIVNTLRSVGVAVEHMSIRLPVSGPMDLIYMHGRFIAVDPNGKVHKVKVELLD